MLERRAQVLADGQDVDVGVAQRLERLVQLVARLAQADHQARLGVDRVADLAGHLLGPAQDVQAAIPAGALADRLLEPLHGLEVVVEDVGPGVHDGPQPVVRAVEVGDQDLDAHARRASRASAVIVSAKIREPPSGRSSRATLVTTTCSRPSCADRLGDAARLVVVEPGRPAGLDGAEPAGPGAGVAQDHDRGGALVPALPDVRAVGLLADRVEVQAAEQALEVVVVLARRHPRPDPVRVASEGGGAVGRRQPGQAAAHRDRRQLRPVCVARPSGRCRTSGGRGPWRECTTRARSGAAGRWRDGRRRRPERVPSAGRGRAGRSRAPSRPWRRSPRR